MHAKNFSLMTHEGKVHLTPAYDILNTTLVLSDPVEEIALPVWQRLIDICFLPREFKTEFNKSIHSRQQVLKS